MGLFRKKKKPKYVEEILEFEGEIPARGRQEAQKKPKEQKEPKKRKSKQ